MYRLHVVINEYHVCWGDKLCDMCLQCLYAGVDIEWLWHLGPIYVGYGVIINS